MTRSGGNSWTFLDSSGGILHRLPFTNVELEPELLGMVKAVENGEALDPGDSWEDSGS